VIAKSHRFSPWWIALLALSLTLAACGESGPLDGLGDRSSQWVQEGVDATTTTQARVVFQVANEGLVNTGDLHWSNDDLGDVGIVDPEQVIHTVWARQIGSRFVQASRFEIAGALPSIRFPGLVPQDVQWVTSQLVYDQATGELDGSTSAAFGLWSVEPYTIGEGQLGVLRVGEAPLEAGTGRSDTVPILVPDGVNLAWTEGGLRYELYCRASITDAVCEAIIDSFVPLATLLDR
jgi:Prokaryotic lipoprotein-attachment site